MTSEDYWKEWLSKVRYSIPDSKFAVSNKDVYEDILSPMREAFEAGFNARRKLSSEEQLQK